MSLESPGETGAVGSAEAIFLLAMQDMDGGMRLGEGVGDLACAVGRIVVDHEEVNGYGEVEHASHERREVIPLVIRRNDDERIRRHRLLELNCRDTVPRDVRTSKRKQGI